MGVGKRLATKRMLGPPRRKGLIDIQMTGVDEIQRTLTRLGELPSRKLLISAMRFAGSVIVDQARANIRAKGIGKTGQLAESLGTRVRNYPTGVTVGIVGAQRGKKHGNRSRLMHLLEFAHRKFLWGTEMEGEMVEPKPFFTPAWEARSREAMDVFGAVLAGGVRKEAAKMGVKFG